MNTLLRVALVLVMLCCGSAFAQSDWILLGKTVGGDTYYLDMSTLEWDDEFQVDAVVKFTAQHPWALDNGQTAQIFVANYEIQCKTQQYTARSLYAVTTSTAFEIKIPNITSQYVENTIFDLICSKVKFLEDNKLYEELPAPLDDSKKNMITI